MIKLNGKNKDTYLLKDKVITPLRGIVGSHKAYLKVKREATA
jgi:hypothetical protein